MNVFSKIIVKIIVFDMFVSGFSCKIISQISCQFLNPNFGKEKFWSKIAIGAIREK